MKITADMLTEEMGFVDGEIILYSFNEDSETGGGRGTVDVISHLPNLSELLVVKPLTGPMSIWNHAPKWAVAVNNTDEAIHWISDINDSVLKCDPARCQYRPWWAK